MQHLCYIYIYNYRCLQDIDLVIDPRYNINFNRENMVLHISQCQNLPDDFWGTGVWSVTGIFGNNGAGKSTFIRFILDAIVDGASNRSVDGVVVYESNGELYVYHNQDFESEKKLDVLYEGNTCILKKKRIHKDASLPKIETFFYMGHFSAEFSYKDLQTVGLSGLYNASEGFKLRNDFEKFTNTTDSYLVVPFSTYLVSHISQNNYRICRLLINDVLRTRFKSFSFPRYIFFTPNRGGQDGLRFNPIIKKELTKEVTDYIDTSALACQFKDSFNECIARFIHFNLLNAIAEKHLLGTKSTIMKQWYSFVNTQQDILPQFQQFAHKHQDREQRILQSIHDAIKLLVDHTHYKKSVDAFYLDVEKDAGEIQIIMDRALSGNFYLTSRFFDMYYSYSDNATGCTLSSGEQSMLNLFSRIYDSIELTPQKFSNIKSPTIILLDEAEIGFHPEWQRNYVKTLLDFLKALKVVSGVNYQVIITSHSPLLLSDIPLCCNNFLWREENTNKTYNVRDRQDETFASNVFELYRTSFFLKSGLIGTFAEQKLSNLKQRIEAGETNVEQEIAIIGDKRIQSYLVSLINNTDKAAAIEFYKRQLRNLGEEIQ